MRKNIQIIARQFTSTKPELFRPQKIDVKTFEYEPFKFGIERQSMIHGYTMEEMYGRFYGIKHSPLIQKELKKDNLIALAILLGGSVITFYYNEWGVQDQANWLQYYYADLTTKRNNLK
ncbi:unnamed protein product [Paramecium sonneborni]|uniref:Uncharacterized protein n=1 Tax=Paramecium sonneborni TaxID=65129 RepID=A0A8S1P2B7_9CILI|nr:unnamed protein product [Paramecium sonneborni]